MSSGGGDDEEGEDVEIIFPGSGKSRAARNPESSKPEEVGEGEDQDRQLAAMPFTDIGNGARFIARFGEDFLHVQDAGWHYWDGTRFSFERGKVEPERHAQRIPSLMWREFEALKEKPGRVADVKAKLGAFARHIDSTGNRGKYLAMIDAAAPHLTVFPREMDADPMLLATPNGTLMLSAHCAIRPNARKDRITRVIGASFDTKAQCPQFLAFLARVQPEPAMREFLQRILGYCLSGSTREHKIFIFYGTGRNGKSTLMDVVREVMGDYAMTSPVSMFLASQNAGGEKASPELARLSGARLVTASEPPEGARLDEGKIKELSGGEPVDARMLHRDYFTFRPKFKLVISTNHQPTIRGTDRGIWSRILMVPWTVEIPEGEIDRDLTAKLKTELPGILNWLLDGYEDYLASGLSPPKEAIAAVEEYRADQDPVGEFLKASCVLTGEKPDPSTGRAYEVEAKILRTRYKEWCDGAGLEPVTGVTFGKKMTGRGFKRRKSNNEVFYLGLQLRAVGWGSDGQ